jgi:hypothetical protein
MTRHDESHEALLQEMSSGDLDAASHRARAVLSDCGECRRRWSETRDLLASLADSDRERLEILASASRMGAAPGEARAVEALRRTIAVPGNVRPRVGRWFLAAAGFVVLVAGLWFLRQRADVAVDDVMLGTRGIECVHPIGSVRSFAPFEWRYDAPAGGRNWLRIEGWSEERGAWVVAWEGNVPGSPWSPPPGIESGWPDRIRWKITRYDASDGLDRSAPWSESLRSP